MIHSIALVDCNSFYASCEQVFDASLVNRPVVWMHPAFANKNMYARNDKEIVCVSLAEK